jgi:tetratricopeptide (TPR) repeat protein
MLLRALSAAVATALLVAGFPALAQAPADGDDSVIRIPGLPPIAIPPGVRMQQNAPPFPDKSPGNSPGLPKGKDAASAAAPAPPPTPEARLAELYARLARATDQDEAQGIVGALERQWLFTTSDTGSLIMTRALTAIQTQKFPLALELLDKLVEMEPQWTEAWNKRATVRFLADDYAGSMEDISHVLALDPKHFGALMGMGTILQRSGNNKRALEAYRRAHEVYPALDNVKRIIDQLAPEVDGRDI